MFPGSGRPPGEGNCDLLQYSCSGNPWTEEPSPWGHERVGHGLETNNNSDTLTPNAQTYTRNILIYIQLFCNVLNGSLDIQ